MNDSGQSNWNALGGRNTLPTYPIPGYSTFYSADACKTQPDITHNFYIQNRIKACRK
jgi:hypothetical protein